MSQQEGTLPIPDNPHDTAQCEHISRLLARISDKWSMLISQKVLASTLRDLEENGFVSRTVTHTTPPQVEYALTALGREFLCPVKALAEWVLENSARMDAARIAYAERRANDA
jgi:DNA-binding HxlR family transcriptional regulator